MSDIRPLPPLSHLFDYATFILSRDLRSYPLNEIENNYFDHLVAFLHDLSANVESLAKNKKLRNDNIVAFNAIPVFFQTAINSEESLRTISRDNPDTRAFLKALAELLQEYKKNKELKPEIKQALRLFFERLARQYEPNRQFERSHTMDFENAYATENA